MRRAQIRHGLDAEQLRRGRKRKSESGLRDWTEAEDVQLLKVVWSGARGLDRSIPTRGYETCKKRLQLIGKHVDPQWLVLQKSDATLTAPNAIAILEDESFHAQVDAARATLRAAAVAPTDLQAHEPSGSPAPATPRSSPAAAVGTPSSTVSEDMVASALDECAEKLVAACDNLALAPTGDHAGATATCNAVRASLAGVVGTAQAESKPTQATHPPDAVYVDACPKAPGLPLVDDRSA